MTRVSENSSSASLQFSINKAKKKMEDLQVKGTTLKKIIKPSDDPMANFQGLQAQSVNKDNSQFLRNIGYALSQLNTTESTLEQLAELLVKAKEIAIQQSSDFYGGNIRKNVSHEIIQVRNQALALANKRLGNRYIFAGYKTLDAPFDKEGNYKGDFGHIQLEVAKDFFIPINLHGNEVFFTDNNIKYPPHPLKEFDEFQPNKNEPIAPDNKNEIKEQTPNPVRELASVTNETDNDPFIAKNNIFSQLTSLITALESNNTIATQDLLEKIDDSISRIITMRTRLGSLVNTVLHTQLQIDTENVENQDFQSKLMDADVAELFSDITKQQHILQTAYQTGKGLMNKSLLNFLS